MRRQELSMKKKSISEKRANELSPSSDDGDCASERAPTFGKRGQQIIFLNVKHITIPARNASQVQQDLWAAMLDFPDNVRLLQRAQAAQAASVAPQHACSIGRWNTTKPALRTVQVASYKIREHILHKTMIKRTIAYKLG